MSQAQEMGNDQATEEVGGGGGGEAKHIKLMVVGENGAEVKFQVKPKTKLGKLKRNYAAQLKLELGVLRFRFDGRAINDDDTPILHGMVDGDTIEVFMQQLGGSGAGGDEGGEELI